MDSNPDPGLRSLLREWVIPAETAPGFRGRVWARIARAEAAPSGGMPWADVIRGLLAPLGRRGFAAVFLAILLAAGSSAGWWQGREQARQMEAALARGYVQAVSPSTPGP